MITKTKILNQIKRWFTLIEMLIVIVIIGILAAVLIPRMVGAQAKARNTSRMVAVQQISNALIRYQGDEWAYTPLSALVPTYLKSLPIDPQNLPFVYTLATDKLSFVLCANLEPEWNNANANVNWPQTEMNFTEVTDTATRKSMNDPHYCITGK